MMDTAVDAAVDAVADAKVTTRSGKKIRGMVNKLLWKWCLKEGQCLDVLLPL